jgi:hypothetical protein
MVMASEVSFSKRTTVSTLSRGNALMKIVNFLLTTNDVLLDEMEVQVMMKWLPDDVHSC